MKKDKNHRCALSALFAEPWLESRFCRGGPQGARQSVMRSFSGDMGYLPALLFTVKRFS